MSLAPHSVEITSSSKARLNVLELHSEEVLCLQSPHFSPSSHPTNTLQTTLYPCNSTPTAYPADGTGSCVLHPTHTLQTTVFHNSRPALSLTQRGAVMLHSRQVAGKTNLEWFRRKIKPTCVCMATRQREISSSDAVAMREDAHTQRHRRTARVEQDHRPVVENIQREVSWS